MHIISINSALYIGDAHLGGAVLLEDARLGRDLRHPRHVRLQAGAALARIRRGLLLRVDTAAATAAAATQRDGRSFIVHLITIRKTRSRDYIYISSREHAPTLIDGPITFVRDCIYVLF